MFPGYVTRASEKVIAASTTLEIKADLMVINDTAVTTAIATINSQFAGFSGIAFLVNVSGANISFTTAGNIQVARTIPTNMGISMLYVASLGKWVPGPIS